MYYGEEEDVILEESCLALSCASQLSAAMMQRSLRKHSVQVCDNLHQRQKYRVYHTLLPQLSRSHEDKFTNYVRVNIHDFEDLCNLTEAADQQTTNQASVKLKLSYIDT